MDSIGKFEGRYSLFHFVLQHEIYALAQKRVVNFGAFVDSFLND